MQSIMLSASSDLTGLRTFAEAFFTALGTHFEERDSASYTDETYFRGRKDGLQFSIWTPDGDNLQHGQFLIEVSSPESEPEDFALRLDCLKRNGFDLWRVHHFGKDNQSLTRL